MISRILYISKINALPRENRESIVLEIWMGSHYSGNFSKIANGKTTNGTKASHLGRFSNFFRCFCEELSQATAQE